MGTRCGQKPEELDHRPATTGTGYHSDGFFGSGGKFADVEGASSVEGDALAFDLGGGMAKPEIPHRTQSAWQDMAQISSNKFRAFDRIDVLRVAVGTVFPPETDVGIGDGYDAGVANGGAADISSEIFDDVFTTAEWLEVHTPVLVPDGGIDGGQRVLFGKGEEAISEAGAKHTSQGGLGHEEFGVFYSDHSGLCIDAGTGDDAVDVRVEMESLIPRVEDHGEAAGLGSEPFGIGECVGQCGGGGGEEELIDVLGLGGEEQGS